MRMNQTSAVGAPDTEDVEVIRGLHFSESEYLEMNPDVRAAVKAGSFTSGRVHFERWGFDEGRLGRRPDKLPQFFAEQPIDTQKLGNVRAESFPYAGPHPWLDRPDWQELLQQKRDRRELSAADAELCRYWVEHGYIILKKCLDEPSLDDGWAAYEAAIARGTVKLQPESVNENDPWPGRYLDPHLKVPELCPVMRHPELLRWVKILMDREPAPYQSITSHKGSQQGEHSDSIHMTTYPLGYLTAAWIAFEDIHPDCGPLVYYPGSHRLPYVFSKDVGITAEEFKQTGYKGYTEKYEPFIKNLLAKNGCQPAYFHAGKGDVLIWHANLIHGGSPRRNLKFSRRAMVCHYFVKGAVTYHDLANSLARPHSGTCLLRKQED
jgi:ectoine hydroxylase-related dioxygenase (phytanoyl-CoA dioxygenase family)